MFSKKSLVALALVAGTVTFTAQSFAQTAEAPARPADLVVSSARLVAHQFYPKFQVTIRNQGLGHAPASKLAVKLHGSMLGMLRNDAGIAATIVALDAIAPGETRTLEIPTGIAVQLRLAAAPAGQIQYFTAVADCHGQVAETMAAGAAELNNNLRFNSMQ